MSADAKVATLLVAAGSAVGVVLWGSTLAVVGLLVVGTLVLAAPLVGMLSATVVSLGVVLAARRALRRHHRGRRAWAVAVAVAALAPAQLLATVLGAVVPDALDALPAQQRAAVAEPISAHRDCHAAWPATRITRLHVADDGMEVEFSCAWSILGWPRFDGWASCADGEWFVAGDAPRYAAACGPDAGAAAAG